MSTTNAILKEYTDQLQGCENDWCDGPTSETLPCFECYDRTREYVIATNEGAGGATETERRLVGTGIRGTARSLITTADRTPP